MTIISIPMPGRFFSIFSLIQLACASAKALPRVPIRIVPLIMFLLYSTT
jgi:hypothetical protein